MTGGTLLASQLLNDKTSLDISPKAALISSSALAALGAIHGFMKGAKASEQFQEQNTLINEAVHKGYIEESIEKVSHKVR